MSDQSLELLMVTIGDSFLRDWEGEESTKEQMEELVDRLSLLKEKLHLPFVSNHPDTRMTEQQVRGVSTERVAVDPHTGGSCDLVGVRLGAVTAPLPSF